MLEQMDASEILKAMEAGLQTGMQYNDQIHNGGGLKVESLDSVLKILANRLDQLVFLQEIPKHKIDNTVHQYKQLYKYGEEIGIFNTEGETPEEAVHREIMEELDTEISVGDLIHTVEYDYPNFHLSMDCFWCQVVKGDLVLKEAEDAKWLTKAELDTVDWLPADITLIDAIRKAM